MELTNALYKYRAELEGSPAWDEALDTLLKLMAPVTPHIAEELWAQPRPALLDPPAVVAGVRRGGRGRSPGHHRGPGQRQRCATGCRWPLGQASRK